MASPAFERFRFSFFEDPDSPRNGLDMNALAALEGEERSRAEDMLLQYLPDPRGLEAVIEVLASADEPMRRLTAAEALYDFRDPAAVAALVKALDDPEGLVRYHAARGLLALHGLPDDSKDPQHMMYQVMSDDAERHDGGKRDILAAIA